MKWKPILLWGGLLLISAIVLYLSYNAYFPTETGEILPESATDTGGNWLTALTAVASLISTIVSTIGMVYTITQSRLEIQQLRAELHEKEK